MLGEGYLLRKALEEAGMTMEQMHPSIRVPGSTSGPILRVRLLRNGNVFAIESTAKTELPGLWTHMDGNHNSFPVLRIRVPLLRIPDDLRFSWQPAANKKATKVVAAERRREMLAAIPKCAANASMANTLDLMRRIWANKGEMLCRAASQANLEDVVNVCLAFQTAIAPLEDHDDVRFFEGLRTSAAFYLQTCDENTLEALELLLFTPGPTSSADKRPPVQLALDTDNFDSRMYRSATRTAMALALLDQQRANPEPSSHHDSATSSVACAFTGTRNEDLQTGKFPQVKLPIVATKGASLFTMNKEAPCNRRYGHEDSALMPISQSLVLKVQDALNYIVRPERKGKTWRPISGEKPDQPDLLIVYVDGMPQMDANVADIFGSDEDQIQRQFSIDVQAICDALSAIVHNRPGSQMHLFIIRSASDGQNFITLAETPSVEEVLRGAQWWQQAAINGPEFSLPVVVEKQVEHWPVQIPSPVQVVQMLTQLWTPSFVNSDDKNKKLPKVRGAAFGEILNLMLQRPDKAEAAAQRILQTLLQHEKSLLIGIGGCIHGRKGWANFTTPARKVALRAVSMLGIALYGLGSEKEKYVKEKAFLIGQFMAMADRLHYCYCTVVRDGSYPPNLIGNAVFSAALDNPEQALATLAERMRIYIGWATTVAREQKTEAKTIAAREAQSILNRYRAIASHFAEADIPGAEQCDDTTRAKMLLGYLAATNKDARDKQSSSDANQSENESEGENK